MVRVHTTRQLEDEQHDRVLAFLDAAHTLDCARLDDHLRVDLAQGPREGFVAALAEEIRGTLERLAPDEVASAKVEANSGLARRSDSRGLPALTVNLPVLMVLPASSSSVTVYKPARPVSP